MEWDGYKDDKLAFIFSLDKKKAYSYNNNGNALRCYNTLGPGFGNSDLCFGHDCLKKKNTWARSVGAKSYNFNGEINAIEIEYETAGYYWIEDYFVYQVLFD